MAGFKRGGARGDSGFNSNKGPAKKRTSPDDEESAPRANKRTKADEEEDEGQAIVPTLAKDEDGNHYISLNASGKRRATVSEFKDNTLISIREYWKNDSGELKPGKKGISLTVDQYQTLLAAAPLLESLLSKKGIQITRPDYEADSNASKGEDEDEGKDKEQGYEVDSEVPTTS